MKNLIFFSLTLLLAASCSTIRVSSDFDKQAQFTSYKTYTYTNEALSLPVNQLNRDRIIAAVDAELALKGFTKSESNPNVLIDIKLTAKQLQTATATNTGPGYGYGYGYGYPYAWGGGFSTTTIDIDTYLEGTLFFDMIDATKKQLIWQGRAVGTIDEEASQKKRENNINYAVKQVFRQYPPKF
jgi:Domain of unknown function (DUF4136)